MGCANSGPVKEIAADRASAVLKNGKVKKAMDDGLSHTKNLELEKVQNDVKEMGDGIKEAIQDGVNELVGQASESRNEGAELPESNENETNLAADAESSPPPSMPSNDSEEPQSQPTDDTIVTGRNSSTSMKETEMQVEETRATSASDSPLPIEKTEET